MDIFSNWQITTLWVVARLYESTDEKGSILGVLQVLLSALWLAGGAGETSKRYLVFTTNIANDECEAIQAHHAPDCRIILDGEVDNLV